MRNLRRGRGRWGRVGVAADREGVCSVTAELSQLEVVAGVVRGAGKVRQLLEVLLLAAVLPATASPLGTIITIIVSAVLAGDAVLDADAPVHVPPVVVAEASLSGRRAVVIFLACLFSVNLWNTAIILPGVANILKAGVVFA